MFEKTYELPLARDYVRHWGVAEAVRELLQNALDSDSPMEYSWGESPHMGITLTITSRMAKLEPKTLLLGTTSKADAKDKIGSFGEGYKIALLVLTRENREVTVYNNGTIWTPAFKQSRQFDAEVLVITETKHPEGRGQGLEFTITGMTSDERHQIKESTLQMQESIGAVINTSYGQILRNRQGKLYVNGLFICDTDFKHGYNIKPEHLKLERDRQTVSSFDLAWIAKTMWFETGLNDEIVEMMSDKAPEMQYANFNIPEVVKEACYQHFIREYPGTLLAESKQELDSLIKKGMTKTVYLGGGSYSSAVRSSSSYTHQAPVIQTPTQHLEQWLRINRGNMRTPAIVSFKELVDQSKEWSTK